MKEFTLNRLPEFDTADAKAYGRIQEEEDGSPTIPWVMVPNDVWTANYGNALQINVQLTR